jgi:hypothetical protein
MRHPTDNPDSEFDARMSAALSAEKTPVPPAREDFAPKPKLEPLPEYLTPRPDVPAVGALSAEAIGRDFELTARNIEAMAADLVKVTNACAAELVELTGRYKAMATELSEVVEHIKETAAAYRDEAKSVFVRIEDTTLRMQEVRDLSTAMRDRLSGKAASTALPRVDLNLTGESD